jgi:hypothetical protein
MQGSRGVGQCFDPRMHAGERCGLLQTTHRGTFCSESARTVMPPSVRFSLSDQRATVISQIPDGFAHPECTVVIARALRQLLSIIPQSVGVETTEHPLVSCQLRTRSCPRLMPESVRLWDQTRGRHMTGMGRELPERLSVAHVCLLPLRTPKRPDRFRPTPLPGVELEQSRIGRGAFSYQGPCPPHGQHSYQWTVEAQDGNGNDARHSHRHEEIPRALKPMIDAAAILPRGQCRDLDSLRDRFAVVKEVSCSTIIRPGRKPWDRIRPLVDRTGWGPRTSAFSPSAATRLALLWQIIRDLVALGIPESDVA